ncbi:iron-sulfur cluster biosynthesis family protein [Niallia sp. Krafla_26]|uniref:iron-sulfur cluster biosynthesis family protein n=1 Tax=Niallia sp. Krafla_26 TaxID=3064703 RepID=UPI003D1821D2
MEILITDRAQKEINERMSDKKGYIKLKYDTDECGCVMCGVSNLWLVSQLDSDDYEVKTNQDSIYMEKSKDVFFDESLTIDFNEKSYCFVLKSPNQYLNPRMSFIDKTAKR